MRIEESKTTIGLWYAVNIKDEIEHIFYSKDKAIKWMKDHKQIDNIKGK